jgi:hypothetical protein
MTILCVTKSSIIWFILLSCTVVGSSTVPGKVTWESSRDLAIAILPGRVKRNQDQLPTIWRILLIHLSKLRPNCSTLQSMSKPRIFFFIDHDKSKLFYSRIQYRVKITNSHHCSFFNIGMQTADKTKLQHRVFNG